MRSVYCGAALCLGLAACVPNSDPTSETETVGTVQTKPSLAIPSIEDMPVSVTEDNYQIFPLSELGLDEDATLAQAQSQLDYRFGVGFDMLGDRKSLAFNDATDGQLIPTVNVEDPGDTIYVLRQFVVRFDFGGVGEAPKPRVVGVRHVCRQVEPWVWTNKRCPSEFE